MRIDRKPPLPPFYQCDVLLCTCVCAHCDTIVHLCTWVCVHAEELIDRNLWGFLIALPAHWAAGGVRRHQSGDDDDIYVDVPAYAGNFDDTALGIIDDSESCLTTGRVKLKVRT